MQATPGKIEAPGRLWHKTTVIRYNAAGGRDVLILAPDLSLLHLGAVARRPGQLTQEDKLKLLSQGLPPEAQNELDIITARYRLAKDCSIVEVKSGQSISYKEVLGSIEYVLKTTKNDGGKFLITLYMYVSCNLLILSIESYAMQISLRKRLKSLFVIHFYPASCTILHWSWKEGHR